MRLKLLSISILAFVLLFNYCCFAQEIILKTPVFKIPEEVAKGLIGIRSVSGKVFAVSANGRYVRFDLETNEIFKGRVPVRNLIDFDIILGQIIFLDSSGRLGGRLRKNWPDSSYNASAIEVCDEGILFSGGDSAVFIEKNATSTFKLNDVHLALPVKNGFLYGFARGSNGRWAVNLLDNFGNLMKQLFEFPPDYQPLGVNLGPAGPENELLVSAYENNSRKLCSIGHNGHMFWKISLPEKKWRRDIAFDNLGNLLVIENKGKEVWVKRWKMTVPEG